MKKVLVLVEGQSEEWFIKNILNPNFNLKNIYFIPTILTTKRLISGPNYKGGVTSYQKIRRDLLRLFSDTSATIVTILIDYYGLPDDFPGFLSRPTSNCYERVEFLENKFQEDINRKNFLPYLQLHEFEALILSNIESFKKVFSDKEIQVQKLEELSLSYNSPEEINENSKTRVSKRIKEILPEYEKILHGQLILMNSNLDKIRDKCSHFNNWLKKIEGWE